LAREVARVQGDQPNNEALQLNADEHPVQAGQAYQVRMPKVDRRLIFVAVLVFIAVLGWVTTIVVTAVVVTSELDATIPIIAAVFAGMTGSISVQVAIDFLRRRRQWAYNASLRETACACHAETLQAITDLTARLDLAPALGEETQVPAHAAQVFEMGRRIGQRQAARAMAEAGTPPGS
jgi:hypothetical protein